MELQETDCGKTGQTDSCLSDLCSISLRRNKDIVDLDKLEVQSPPRLRTS